MIWAGSLEAGARRLVVNSSGWRRSIANRQVRLDGNKWVPGQRCSVETGRGEGGALKGGRSTVVL